MFIRNNLSLSDEEDNTSGPLNRGGIAELPMSRMILANSQKSRVPSVWEATDSFVLLTYPSLAGSRTFLQILLNFVLILKALINGSNKSNCNRTFQDYKVFCFFYLEVYKS